MIPKTCKNCGKGFLVKNYKKDTAKYCSRACMKEDKQAPMLTIICSTCNKEFQREKHKQNSSHYGTYCSQTCYRIRSPQVKVQCICGQTFKVFQSRMGYYKRLFCSKKCYTKNGFHGRLTDDIPEINNYSKFVAKLRSTAKYLIWAKTCLTRDNNQCISCQVQQNLTVHHIISIYDLVKKHGLNCQAIENDPIFFNTNNGITLCRSCHLKKHGDPDND